MAVNRDQACSVVIGCAFAIAIATGCMAPYAGTAPANLGDLGLVTIRTTDGMRFQLPERQSAAPALTVPTSIALARVQHDGSWRRADAEPMIVEWRIDPPAAAPDRTSIPSAEQLERLDALDGVNDALTILPAFRHSSESMLVALRRAAVERGAGLLMLYTFETRTESSGGLPPLDLVTLGTLPDVVSEATTSAHAVLIDARTGFIYALAHAEEETWQLASHWTKDSAEEDVLARAERRAFDRLLDDFATAWPAIVRAFGAVR
jgi:hypothetical protein